MAKRAGVVTGQSGFGQNRFGHARRDNTFCPFFVNDIKKPIANVIIYVDFFLNETI